MKPRNSTLWRGETRATLAALAAILAIASVTPAFAGKPPKPPPSPPSAAAYTYLHLGTLGGANANAFAINNAGLMIGWTSSSETTSPRWPWIAVPIP